VALTEVVTVPVGWVGVELQPSVRARAKRSRLARRLFRRMVGLAPGCRGRVGGGGGRAR
jgi:hypothetical protein